MSITEVYRPYLTLLIWGLLCEIIVLIYFVTNKMYRFEFYLTLVLLPITLGGIALMIRTIKKELTGET